MELEKVENDLWHRHVVVSYKEALRSHHSMLLAY